MLAISWNLYLCSAWRMSDLKFLLVRIFLYLDWRQIFKAPFLSRLKENTHYRKLLARTLFTWCILIRLKLFLCHQRVANKMVFNINSRSLKPQVRKRVTEIIDFREVWANILQTLSLETRDHTLCVQIFRQIEFFSSARADNGAPK